MNGGLGSAQYLFELDMGWLQAQPDRDAAHNALVREALAARPPISVRAAAVLRALAAQIDAGLPARHRGTEESIARFPGSLPKAA